LAGFAISAFFVVKDFLRLFAANGIRVHPWFKNGRPGGSSLPWLVSVAEEKSA
jgi:hypothetical protein